MGVFYFCSKCNKRTDNTNANNLCNDCEISVTDFYFAAWCEEHGIIQAAPWKVHNTTEIQTMEDAAIMFAKELTERESVTVSVQDWRGRIVKFKITISLIPEYFARRI